MFAGEPRESLPLLKQSPGVKFALEAALKEARGQAGLKVTLPSLQEVPIFRGLGALISSFLRRSVLVAWGALSESFSAAVLSPAFDDTSLLGARASALGSVLLPSKAVSSLQAQLGRLLELATLLDAVVASLAWLCSLSRTRTLPWALTRHSSCCCGPLTKLRVPFHLWPLVLM